MADPVVVQQPASGEGNGTGFLLGIVLLILFFIALFYYGLPMIQSATSTPQMNVPSEVDVNVNRE